MSRFVSAFIKIQGQRYPRSDILSWRKDQGMSGYKIRLIYRNYDDALFPGESTQETMLFEKKEERDAIFEEICAQMRRKRK